MDIRFLISIVLVGLSCEGSHSAPPPIPSASPRSLLVAADLTRVDRVEAIPASVMDAYSKLFPVSRNDALGLANPGESWQCCCSLSRDGPPRRRLIFAGGSPTLWFLYFEEGGLAVDYHFITFALDSPGQAEPLESLAFQEWPQSLGDVKRLAATAQERHYSGRVGQW